MKRFVKSAELKVKRSKMRNREGRGWERKPRGKGNL